MAAAGLLLGGSADPGIVNCRTFGVRAPVRELPEELPFGAPSITRPVWWVRARLRGVFFFDPASQRGCPFSAVLTEKFDKKKPIGNAFAAGSSLANPGQPRTTKLLHFKFSDA